MEPANSPEMSLGRVEAFSDGVFAVAVTLLVLNITVPDLPQNVATGDFIDALRNGGATYLGYFISFATIGAVWLGHHRLLKLMVNTDQAFQLLNVLFLMIIVLIPFTTSLMTKYLNAPQLASVVTFIFGFNWLISSLLMMAMWRYLRRARLLKANLTADSLRRADVEFNGRGVIFSLVGMILALISPPISIAVYLLALFINFVVPLATGISHAGRSPDSSTVSIDPNPVAADGSRKL